MKGKKVLNKNSKLLTGIIVGGVLAGTIVYASIIIQGSNVGYTDTRGLGATTVQEAIEKVYDKVKLGNDRKFVEAYTYNQTSGASNYCVTGNESTCVATTCYKTKSVGACPAGTIIRYKVRPGEVETFHVMYDDASTITMQAQRNTVYNTAWITKGDYVAAGGTESDYGSFGNNNKGPITILTALESATAGWSNVKDITYTAGTTTFKTNAYTGCSAYNTCSTNTYTLSSRTAKARMITSIEASLMGCTDAKKSCPIWMYNYLNNSVANGGTENDPPVRINSFDNIGYWTMSANSQSPDCYAMHIEHIGSICEFNAGIVSQSLLGIRAVVKVSK